VRIIDITNKASPTAVTNISWTAYSLSGPMDLVYNNNLLYIASYTNDAVNIVDVSIPALPVLVNKILHNASYQLLDWAYWLYKAWNYLYVASANSDAITILEQYYPKEQMYYAWRINNATTLNSAYDVVVDWNYAYMTLYDYDAVQVIDISNKASPSIVGTIRNTTTLNWVTWIVKDWNYLYVSANIYDAVQVINVSNPASPSIAGTLQNSTTLNWARWLAKSGNYLYVTTDVYDAVQVINVTTPTSPVIAGTIRNTTTLNWARDIKILWNYAYVSAYDWDYLTIVNITTPTTPTIAWSLYDATNLNWAWWLSVSWNYAYVSSYLNNSIRVVDITNKTSPTWVTNIYWEYYSMANPRSSIIDNNLLYVTSYTSDAINIIDVSTPASPKYVNKILHNATYQLLDWVYGIYKSGDYLYMASYNSDALTILKLSNPNIVWTTSMSYSGVLFTWSLLLWTWTISNAKIQLSKDGWTNWYYYNWSSRTLVNTTSPSNTQTSEIWIISSNLATFNNLPWWTNLKIKVYLNTDWSQNLEVDNVTFSSDNWWPIVSLSLPWSWSIFPYKNPILSYVYSDDWSGVNTWATLFGIYKWNWSTWWSNLSGSLISWSTIWTWSSIFSWSNLAFGKYKTTLTLSDYIWNTWVYDNVFYIDEVEMIVSTWTIDIWNIAYNTKKFSPEVIITIKTVWTPFKVYMSQNWQLQQWTNIIIDWDWNEWYWYDSDPYTDSIFTIWNMKQVWSGNFNPNINWLKNTYNFKVKLWAMFKDLEQAAGTYQTYINFTSVFDY